MRSSLFILFVRHIAQFWNDWDEFYLFFVNFPMFYPSLWRYCTGWAKNGTVCVEHFNFVKY